MYLREYLAHRPHWLYESLPALYIVIGLFAMLKLNNHYAMAGGGLFVLAGGYISLLRYRYRRAGKKGEGSSDFAMLALVWTRARECGHALLDGQHKALFQLAHALLDAAMDSKRDRADALLKALVDELEKHFVMEEQILRTMDLDLADSCQRRNRFIVGQMNKLIGDYSADPTIRNRLIQYVIYEAVVGHVNDDREIIEEAIWS